MHLLGSLSTQLREWALKRAKDLKGAHFVLIVRCLGFPIIIASFFSQINE